MNLDRAFLFIFQKIRDISENTGHFRKYGIFQKIWDISENMEYFRKYGEMVMTEVYLFRRIKLSELYTLIVPGGERWGKGINTRKYYQLKGVF